MTVEQQETRETRETQTHFRLLPAEEWHKLVPLFLRSFEGAKELPSPPPFSFALVAEDPSAGGEIVAALFFRQEFHMEPFCANPGQGKLYPEMVELMESVLLREVGPLYYVASIPNTEKRVARERQLGRVVLADYVPVAKRLE